MPTTSSGLFNQAQLELRKKRLEKLAGKLGAVIESLKDSKIPALTVEYAKPLDISLDKVESFIDAAGKAYELVLEDRALNGQSHPVEDPKKPARKK